MGSVCGTEQDPQDYHRSVQTLRECGVLVETSNARAIRLYEKFGFVKIGRYPGFLKVNGVNVDCDLMNLYL